MSVPTQSFMAPYEPVGESMFAALSSAGRAATEAPAVAEAQTAERPVLLGVGLAAGATVAVIVLVHVALLVLVGPMA